MSSAEDFLTLLERNPDGVSDPMVREHFQAAYSELVPVINEMLESKRLNLLRSGDTLVYQLVPEDTAAKFEGLSMEQLLVYQTIDRSGNRGIWTRDIKNATNIQQQTLTKTLKVLESRQLIKAIKSVTSKSKKLYMRFDLTPAKELTGGPWYTEQEFDHEFIDHITETILHLIETQENQGQMASLSWIAERIQVSGVSTVELTTDEVQLLLNTMVYDRKIEEVPPAVMRLTGHAVQGPIYKLSKPVNTLNYFTSMPCGVCPVISQCVDGGVISPATCVYYTQWLEANDLDF